MRTKTHLWSISLVALAVLACEGPTGPQGAPGVDGTDGTDGTDGNANVTMYTFGERTTTTGSLNYTLDVSREAVDNSLILVYFNPSTETESAWYQSPGLGSGGFYMTRYFLFQTSQDPSRYSLSIRLHEPDDGATYTTSTTFRQVKVILAPASTILPAMASGALDVGSLAQVSAHLGIE